MNSMIYSKKEDNLISFFQHMDKGEICLIPANKEIEEVISAIVDLERWAKWTNSSKKNDPPPDFYCDELSLMMEVMRVDDHGYEVEENIINPTYQREHEIEKELSDEGVFDFSPNLKSVIINARTDLPTEEDHNYQFYLDNFKRTVTKHIGHITNYKRNHPGYKVIFFIFDESSAYFVKLGDSIIMDNQTAVPGQQHWFFADEAFVKVFRNSDIDYIVWCAPFKYINAIGSEPIQVRAAVIDVKQYDVVPITYDSSKMVSSEE